jgi:uncharacterized MAPEG superfamily protein
MTPTLTAVVGFAAWYVLLTLVLATYRSGLVLGGKRAANTFRVDGSDTPGFGARLTRARDNCYETLPVFVALAVVATLAARVGQSLTHLVSTSVPAVLVRANLFFLQVLIYGWWSIRLLTA